MKWQSRTPGKSADWRKNTNNDHSICFPSYDTTATDNYIIKMFLLLRSTNNFLQYKPYGLFRQKSYPSLNPQPTISCPLTCSKHSHNANRKLAAPINQILAQSNPSQNSAVYPVTGWCHSVQRKTNSRKKGLAPPWKPTWAMPVLQQGSGTLLWFKHRAIYPEVWILHSTISTYLCLP